MRHLGLRGILVGVLVSACNLVLGTEEGVLVGAGGEGAKGASTGTGGGEGGAGPPPACSRDADCLDDDLCTLETCGPDGTCLQVGAADDHDACTLDTCDPVTGEVANTPVSVNDNNPCTYDQCDPATGTVDPFFIPLYSERFDDNSRGWALGPQWQIGSAAATTTATNGGDDPASDFSSIGDGLAGTAIGGLVAETLPDGSFLTSPAIDLSTLSGAEYVSVRYRRWLNANAPKDMTAFVEVLDCPVPSGGDPTWTRIWQNTGQVIDAPSTTLQAGGTGWFLVRHDITAAALACRAAGQPIRIRFGFTKLTSPPSMGGWNIDDFALDRSLFPADDDLCTDDVCTGVDGVPTAAHPQLVIDDGNVETNFACDPGTGPTQIP